MYPSITNDHSLLHCLTSLCVISRLLLRLVWIPLEMTTMSDIASVFRKLFGLINIIRKVILNIIFFVLLILVIGLFSAEEQPIVVPNNSLLTLNLSGVLVEEKTWVHPLDAFVNELAGSHNQIPEVVLSDVINAIDEAATDDRISGLNLELSQFLGGGLNKMKTVGEAIERFRATGKPVMTYADHYTQSQYYLAAHADRVYLNPLGMVAFEGFGSYRLYFKDLLEKLKISANVFKVGAYKSAVEPYTRNDMSQEAREANQLLYDELWDTYVADLAQLREIDPRILSGQMEDFIAAVAEHENDIAAMAVTTGLVTALYSREQFRQEMIDLTGHDDEKKSWKKIGHEEYLAALNGPAKADSEQPADDKVAIVIARGTIVDGHQKAGMIGGDSTAALLRKARLDDDVKAVVLRVDSPGGSGFASEIIRQEVLELKKAGKPVIASMSSVAASGGYWISASADEIWATPETITGSIGVFGMFFTVENSLAHIGVYNDGYHTTNMPVLDVTRGLDEHGKYLIQISIEKFYRDFVSMVAESRDMTYDAVHEVAQGRIWTGQQALQLGLVDALGELDDAIAAAAQRAELENYEVMVVEPDLSAKEKFLQEMFGQATALVPASWTAPTYSPLEIQLQRIFKEVKLLNQFNDPNGVYALCEICPLP